MITSLKFRHYIPVFRAEVGLCINSKCHSSSDLYPENTVFAIPIPVVITCNDVRMLADEARVHSVSQTKKL